LRPDRAPSFGTLRPMLRTDSTTGSKPREQRQDGIRRPIVFHAFNTTIPLRPPGAPVIQGAAQETRDRNATAGHGGRTRVAVDGCWPGHASPAKECRKSSAFPVAPG
jgi:hypothetical protein